VTALDTNVLVDLDEGGPDVAEAALRAIEMAGERGRLVVCGVVYAELCARRVWADEDVPALLRASQIEIDADMPLAVWTAAGLAFAAHSRRRRASRGEAPRRIVADFVIGAHAQSVGALVTSDADFYRRAFPDLMVVDVRPVGRRSRG
jgi:predicted nucleic acid-binding protein